MENTTTTETMTNEELAVATTSLVANAIVGAGVKKLVKAGVETLVDKDELSTKDKLQINAASWAITAVIVSKTKGIVNKTVEDVKDFIDICKVLLNKEEREKLLAEVEGGETNGGSENADSAADSDADNSDNTD